MRPSSNCIRSTKTFRFAIYAAKREKYMRLLGICDVFEQAFTRFRSCEWREKKKHTHTQNQINDIV